ncbi:MAG: PHP domain-containing protein [Bacteroidales bacterium]
MNLYRADLHIHRCTSPCGDLDMSLANIIDKALEKGIDIIGITDHNSTRHCSLIRDLARPAGIFVLMGAEVTTREEVHCLVPLKMMIN